MSPGQKDEPTEQAKNSKTKESHVPYPFTHPFQQERESYDRTWKEEYQDKRMYTPTKILHTHHKKERGKGKKGRRGLSIAAWERG